MGDIPPKQKTQPEFAFEANPMQEPMLTTAELRQMERCARSVVLIEVTRYRQRKRESVESSTGTGWLIAPGLVLTCWHVVAALYRTNDPIPSPLDLKLQIEHMLLTFNHVEAGAGIQYKASRLEYPVNEANPQDFAILRLEDRSDYPYQRFPYLLVELDTPFTEQLRLSIIQHPLGQAQQMPITPGYFVNHPSQTTQRIFYTTATNNGASGAPVLNCYNWRVVALHEGENRGVQLREGMRIKYIMSELQNKKPKLYKEIMKAQDDLSSSLHSMHLLGSYVHSSNVTSQASFSVTVSPEQEAASFSASQQTVSSSDRDQQYEYIYSSSYDNPSAVACLAFHPNGLYLASGGYTDTINIWNVPAKSLEYMLKTYASVTPSLAFSPYGEYLASGGNDGAIILWEFLRQKRVKTVQGHNEWVSCLAFSSDGHYLVSGSDDRSIKVWDIPQGTLARFLKQAGEVFDIALHPLNQLIASCVAGQNVKLESTFLQETPSFAALLARAYRLAFSPDGRYLVVGNEQGSITIYETTSWKVVHTLARHVSRVRCLAFHPHGKLLASGGDDRVIQLWELSSGKNIQTLVKHTDRIESLAFSPNGQYIASGGKDANIILWKKL